MTVDEQEAIAKLRVHSSPPSSVNIAYGPSLQYPLARDIAGLFDTAGWQCKFLDIPQERAVGYPYREGVEISGVNEYLVRRVAEALAAAGVRDLRPTVRERRIARTNPKYQWVERRIKVHVGHLPGIGVTDQSAVPEGTWTKAV
jgi:hypothetical protein